MPGGLGAAAQIAAAGAGPEFLATLHRKQGHEKQAQVVILPHAAAGGQTAGRAQAGRSLQLSFFGLYAADENEGVTTWFKVSENQAAASSSASAKSKVPS